MTSTTLPRLIAIASEGAQLSAIEPIFRSLATPSSDTNNNNNQKQLFSSVHFGDKIEDFADAQKNIIKKDDPLVVVLGAPSSPKILEHFLATTSSSSTSSSNIKLIYSLFTGVDGFQPDFLHKLVSPLSIPVANARGVYSVPLAEHVLLGILYFMRKVSTLQHNRKNKIWDRYSNPSTSKKTCVVVGFGEIAKCCAKRIIGGLDMNVVGVRSCRQESDAGRVEKCAETGATVIFGNDALDKILPEADVVLAVLPNTPQTKHVFNKERFSKFKKGAIFINIGRGHTVDDDALVDALVKSNHLQGAAIDVFEKEPLPHESPLWQVEDSKMLFTPHNADITPTLFEDSASYFAQIAEKFVLEGKVPDYLVDLSKGY